jgi:RNA polymerase sigma factor (sigma-70 family)
MREKSRTEISVETNRRMVIYSHRSSTVWDHKTAESSAPEQAVPPTAQTMATWQGDFTDGMSPSLTTDEHQGVVRPYTADEAEGRSVISHPQPLRRSGAVSNDVTPGRRPREKWELNASAFSMLLARLDPDLDRAGEKYTLIRKKLVTFFECRGSAIPADLADETINRVARSLQQGKEIQAADPSLYFYGVARYVLREVYNGHEQNFISMDEVAMKDHPSYDPGQNIALAHERHLHERRLECLEHCLRELPPEARELFLAYHKGERRTRIEHRRALAKQLGITVNALKVRVHRLRNTLRHRINKLIATFPGETNLNSAHIEVEGAGRVTCETRNLEN